MSELQAFKPPSLISWIFHLFFYKKEERENGRLKIILCNWLLSRGILNSFFITGLSVYGIKPMLAYIEHKIR